MAIRDILEIGHPVLATRANEVPNDHILSAETQAVIDDMIDTMRDANGAGIAANQIGISSRMFVIEVNNNPRYPYKPTIPLTVVINPVIELLSEEVFMSNEGCLSVPNFRGEVARNVEIAVSYYDRNARLHRQEVRGYSACTWQHEYDHLDGVLFPHRVSDPQSFSSWSVFQEFKQAAFAEKVRQLVDCWGA